MKSIADDMCEALEAMLSDYRTEGCPKPNCVTCQKSRAAEQKAYDAIKKYKGGGVMQLERKADEHAIYREQFAVEMWRMSKEALGHSFDPSLQALLREAITNLEKVAPKKDVYGAGLIQGTMAGITK